MTDAEQKQLDEWKRAAREWRTRAEAAETVLLDILDTDADDDYAMGRAQEWAAGPTALDAAADEFLKERTERLLKRDMERCALGSQSSPSTDEKSGSE